MKTKKVKLANTPCKTCRKPIDNTFAFIVGGASVRGSLRVMKQLDGYLAFGVHGAHSGGRNDPSANIVIVKDTPHGEFELVFCSTKCMRKFLNSSVDAVESGIEKEKRRDAKRLARKGSA